MDFYEIQLPSHQIQRQMGTSASNETNNPQRFVVEAPPPFNTAHLVSSPVIHEDPPPPTYEESLKTQPMNTAKEMKDIENYM